MSEWKKKRFWTETSVCENDSGFGVALDGRVVRTPAKAELFTPTRAFAEAVCREWDAVEDVIDPNQMPFTRTVNAAIDKVAVQHAEVAAMIADYGGTDLLCYRAESPEELRARQDAAWDPMLAWAEKRFGAALVCTAGVMHISQPESALSQLSAQVYATNAFELAALHDLVSISGSLIIGLAVTEGVESVDTLWALSRIDETWQQEQWGEDEEAVAQAEHKRAAFAHAAEVWRLCQPQ